MHATGNPYRFTETERMSGTGYMWKTIVKRCRDVVLLAGTGTQELLPAIERAGNSIGVENPVRGVFGNFKEAMDTAVSFTHAGDVLLFSPGFTSFGMFLNEFDRGDRFVAYVRALEAKQ